MKLQLGGGGPVKLGRELGRGGEGAVFDVVDQAGLVAKIYHAPPDRDKGDKLAAMAKGCTERLAKIAAWPTDTVFDAATGEMRGFVMRRVSRQKDIHLLYGPKTRLRDYPDATYRFLVHVATNVARAFAVIHEHGHVVGDVNQGGVCVSEQGTISLVDCDSFQVGAGSRTFHCDVGIPIYQPPEFQSIRTFRGLPRSANHDAFGIAVLIFQTLFLARHPFAGAFQGSGDMSIERAIGEHRFAYGRDAARRQMKQPPGSLGLGAVPSRVGHLFERAFLEDGVAGRRPTALEWVSALDEYAAELRDCTKNPGHAYAKGLAACPLCTIEGRTGTLLFLTPRQASASAPTVNLEDLWRDLIPAFGAARVPAAALEDTPDVSAPDAVIKFRRAKERAWKLTCIGTIGAMSLAIAWHPAALIGAVLVVLVARATRGEPPDEAQNAPNKMAAARDHLQTLVHQVRHDCASSPLPDLERRAEALYRGLKDFPDRRAKRMSRLESGRRERQLRRHLDQFEVKDSKIKGFGPGLYAALVSNGVETADDLTEDNLEGIAGFGPKRVAALLEWRRTVEQTFRFDPADAADARDRARAERDLQIEYAKEITDLQRAAEQIKAHAGPLRGRLVAISGQIERARNEFAVRQATSSLLAQSHGTAFLFIIIPLFVALPFALKAIREPTTDASRGGSSSVTPVDNASVPKFRADVSSKSTPYGHLVIVVESGAKGEGISHCVVELRKPGHSPIPLFTVEECLGDNARVTRVGEAGRVGDVQLPVVDKQGNEIHLYEIAEARGGNASDASEYWVVGLNKSQPWTSPRFVARVTKAHVTTTPALTLTLEEPATAVEPGARYTVRVGAIDKQALPKVPSKLLTKRKRVLTGWLNGGTHATNWRPTIDAGGARVTIDEDGPCSMPELSQGAIEAVVTAEEFRWSDGRTKRRCLQLVRAGANLDARRGAL